MRGPYDKTGYEHSEDLTEAMRCLADLRKRLRRLHWMSGGQGYDNMGKRELEQVRIKLDEADHWLAAASRALNAGGARAIALRTGGDGETAVTP